MNALAVRSTVAGGAALLLQLACAASARPPDSDAAVPRPAGDAAMASRVLQAFLHAWHGYRRYAWGHDDLNPISKTPHDWYGTSLLMTPVDAFDTMILMGLAKEAADASV